MPGFPKVLAFAVGIDSVYGGGGEVIDLA